MQKSCKESKDLTKDNGKPYIQTCGLWKTEDFLLYLSKLLFLNYQYITNNE